MSILYNSSLFVKRPLIHTSISSGIGLEKPLINDLTESFDSTLARSDTDFFPKTASINDVSFSLFVSALTIIAPASDTTLPLSCATSPAIFVAAGVAKTITDTAAKGSTMAALTRFHGFDFSFSS